MKFYYSSYGKYSSNQLGCGAVIKIADGEDISKIISLDNMFFGMNSLYSIGGKDFSNVYSMGDTFHNCHTLNDVEGIAGKDKSFKNCLNVSWGFAGAGSSYAKTKDDGISWVYRFPVCTDISFIFLNCSYGIKEFKEEQGKELFPSVIYGKSAFENTNISSFTCSLKSLQIGTAMFYMCKRLTTFNSDLGSLITGIDMFTNSKLSYTSISNIYNKIKDLSNWKTEFESTNTKNVHPSNHPFSGIQKYILAKSNGNVTYVRSVFHTRMDSWCNRARITNITNLSGETGQELICKSDNYKDSTEYYRKNPSLFAKFMGYSSTSVTDVGKLTIGYDGADINNTTSAINLMKTKFAAKGWTVTFVKN